MFTLCDKNIKRPVYTNWELVRATAWETAIRIVL